MSFFYSNQSNCVIKPKPVQKDYVQPKADQKHDPKVDSKVDLKVKELKNTFLAEKMRKPWAKNPLRDFLSSIEMSAESR